MTPLERFIMTVSCTDSDSIPKVKDAGKFISVDEKEVQIMHNGLKVLAGGYHGDWMSDIIRSLRGHHEPQEEKLFHSLLRFVRGNSIFVELGAFWAYYSNWYMSAIPGSTAYCIEPDVNSLSVGKSNTDLNGNKAIFINASVGKEFIESSEFVQESDKKTISIPCFNMDAILNRLSGSPIEVLHMDIQGAEYPFLTSLSSAVKNANIRFIMVSTHHWEISGAKTTHQDCINAILNLGGYVLAEYSVEESFSGDGLIIASFFESDRIIKLPDITRNKALDSLFRGR